MSFEKRLEKSIARIEKNIEKQERRIGNLQMKHDDHKITRAEFNIKKRQIEEHINAMKTRMRVLQGGLAKEKRHQEEKAEAKLKKKEEKEKKKKSKQE